MGLSFIKMQHSLPHALVTEHLLNKQGVKHGAGDRDMKKFTEMLALPGYHGLQEKADAERASCTVIQQCTCWKRSQSFLWCQPHDTHTLGYLRAALKLYNGYKLCLSKEPQALNGAFFQKQ